jgi:MFS family permease
MFVSICLLGRIFHGFEDVAFECMSVFYLANTSDQKTKDRAFSIYKIAGGIGYILGSLICPVIYHYLGYFMSFMVLCLVYIGCTGVVLWCFPRDEIFK